MKHMIGLLLSAALALTGCHADPEEPPAARSFVAGYTDESADLHRRVLLNLSGGGNGRSLSGPCPYCRDENQLDAVPLQGGSGPQLERWYVIQR